MALKEIICAAQTLSACAERILPPHTLLQTCEALRCNHPQISKRTIGHDRNHKDITAYQYGSNGRAVLLYGFPDPGEAIGGTSILCLLKGLVKKHPFLEKLNLCWHVIPCLNLPDQPDNGNTLQKTMRSTAQKEVDWCVNEPRPETSALLDYCAAAKPAIVFPLHDEYHSGEYLPAYTFGTATNHPDTTESIKQICQHFNIETADDFYLDMTTCADFNNSTFSVMQHDAQIFCCELSRQEGLSEQNLIAAQLACILLLCSNRQRNQ